VQLSCRRTLPPGGGRLLRSARLWRLARGLPTARDGAPESLAADLAEEAATLDYLERETEHGSVSRAGKYLSAGSQRRLQKRGRKDPAPPPEDETSKPDDETSKPGEK
jgi:Ca-activated chloride channel family protein